MSRNGSGTYTVPNTFVPGEVVTASDHNENWSDVAAEITNSVAVDGQSTMTGALKASSGTAAAPALTFGSDTDTGAYRSGANAYSVAAGGVQITETTSAGLDVKSGTLLLAGVSSFPVPTAQITDAAVTLAKQANLAASTFIGRYTASTGVPQALTLSTGLSVNTSTGAVTTTTNPALLPGFLSGLTLSTAGSSATFGIAVGGANDTTNATLMALTSAYTKMTSAWTLGTAAGALDTGTIANSTWYHVYLIARSDTGVVDILVSTSASAPTMPASYDRKRRIGSMKTNGSGQWTKFTQVGDRFLWEVPVTIANSTYATASRATLTLTVPTGLNVNALFKVAYNGTGGGNGAYITSLVAETDTTTSQDISSGGYDSQNFARITNTSGQIGLRPTNAADLFGLATYGWEDARGK